MAPVDPVAAVFGSQTAALPRLSVPPSGASGFGDLLAAGLREVDVRVARADALTQAYAQGEAVPVHQVTLALEQARLAVELAVQVRARLVETYRDFMNMQL